MATKCWQCSQAVPRGASFCQHCGAPAGPPPAMPYSPVANINITQEVSYGRKQSGQGGCALIILLVVSCCIWSNVKESIGNFGCGPPSSPTHRDSPTVRPPDTVTTEAEPQSPATAPVVPSERVAIPAVARIPAPLAPNASTRPSFTVAPVERLYTLRVTFSGRALGHQSVKGTLTGIRDGKPLSQQVEVSAEGRKEAIYPFRAGDVHLSLERMGDGGIVVELMNDGHVRSVDLLRDTNLRATLTDPGR